MYGFSNSPYYLANPDVQFSYSVNGVNVLRDSSLSLADVGLVDEGFVDLEIPVTINFRLRDVSFYFIDFIYLFIARCLLVSGSQSRNAVQNCDSKRIPQFAILSG
jgi:hypothetical protein